MSTTKLILINNIRTPTNYPRKYTLETIEKGKNTHISNEATPTMAPFIVSNNMTAIK